MRMRNTQLVSFWKLMAFVQQLKKSWSQNKIHMLFLFLSLLSLGWLPVTVTQFLHWASLYHLIWFQVASPTTLKMRAMWTYVTWAYIKPHSGLKSENSLECFVCWIFFSHFWLYSAKIHKSMRGQPKYNINAFVWVRKRCPSRQISSSGNLSAQPNLHNWMQQPWQELLHLFLSRDLKTLKFTCLNWEKPH